MSSPTEITKKTSGWITLIWVVGAVVAFYFILRFSSPRAGGASETGSITSVAQYNDEVNKLEEKQLPVMSKYFSGEALTTADEATLDECLKSWQALIAYAPTRPANHFGAGELCFVKADYPDSIRHLQSVINQTSDKATGDFREMRLRALAMISQASFFIGRYDQAAQTAKMGQAMDGEDPQFALLEAQALGQIDAKVGIALLETYVKKYPDYEPLKRRLEFFKKPQKKN